MTLGTRAQLFRSRTFRTVRRPGLYADIDGVGDAALFNVSGLVQIHNIFGVCTTVIGAGAAIPRIQFTPTAGAVQIPLCAAAASIATDAAGTVYTWTGLIGGQLTPGGALGMSDVNANSTWVGGWITLAAGVIELTNAVDANSGVIDWYAMYLPVVAGSLITAG